MENQEQLTAMLDQPMPEIQIVIWTTDGSKRTFEEMTNILNNLIGPYSFYLQGEVQE